MAGMLLGGIFFSCALFALTWAYREGQLRDLDDGAWSIFDEDEPAGMTADHFPARGGIPRPSGGNSTVSVP